MWYEPPAKYTNTPAICLHGLRTNAVLGHWPDFPFRTADNDGPPAGHTFFGPVGLVAGQTARLTAVSLARLTTGDPCRVALYFVDSSGATLTNADSQPVQATARRALSYGARPELKM